MVAHTSIKACELKNKRSRWRALRHAAGLALAIGFLLVAGTSFAQQPAHAQPTPDHAAAGVAAQPDEHATEGEHGSMWGALLWPTVNFLILFGGLWYFLKEPLVTYLRDRHGAIRKDLVEAAAVKSAAAAQLAEIDRKLQALPGEIDALRNRGAEEIVAEEARIAALAAAERERLLEQTRREIALQVRLAKRELVEHAADLAVQMAGDRIERQLTPQDQDRLVERYLENVKGERPA
jgi:F-type H+-transporting ATPase subunit b